MFESDVLMVETSAEEIVTQALLSDDQEAQIYARRMKELVNKANQSPPAEGIFLNEDIFTRAARYIEEKSKPVVKVVKEEVCNAVATIKNHHLYQSFLNKFKQSNLFMEPPNIIVINSDVYPGKDPGDPVYFINGVLNSKADAIRSATFLSDKLKRQVYLIYNPSAYTRDGVVSPTAPFEDFTETLYDMISPLADNLLVEQKNPTTKQVTHLLYHAALNNTPISIVSHSQACVIVRNACFTISLVLDQENYVKEKVAWVAAGTPVNDNLIWPKPRKFRPLRNPNDIVAQILSASGVMNNPGESLADHEFVQYYNQIREEDIWQIDFVKTTANILALGRNANQGQEIFYIKNDSYIYHRFQAYPNASHWEGEFSFYDTKASQIAIGRNNNQTQEIFYIDNNLHQGFIYHFVQRYPGAPMWDGPFDFDPNNTKKVSQIALGRNRDGRQEIFYIRDGEIFHYVQNGADAPSWSGEFKFYDARASQIALGCNEDGRQEIFFIREGKIFHRFQNFADSIEWSGEFDFKTNNSNSPITQIALGRNQNGTQELFYIQDGEIFHFVQQYANSPGWDGPFKFYDTKANRLALGRNENGGQELFYTTPETGEIYHRFQPHANASDWSPLFPFYKTVVINQFLGASSGQSDSNTTTLSKAPKPNAPQFKEVFSTFFTRIPAIKSLEKTIVYNPKQLQLPSTAHQGTQTSCQQAAETSTQKPQEEKKRKYTPGQKLTIS